MELLPVVDALMDSKTLRLGSNRTRVVWAIGPTVVFASSKNKSKGQLLGSTNRTLVTIPSCADVSTLLNAQPMGGIVVGGDVSAHSQLHIEVGRVDRVGW